MAPPGSAPGGLSFLNLGIRMFMLHSQLYIYTSQALTYVNIQRRTDSIFQPTMLQQHIYYNNMHELAHIMVIEHGEDRGIMIGDHEARALQPLGLVNQHVTPLVVCIISNHHTS